MTVVGRVVALDRSESMIGCARRRLETVAGDRVTFVVADLARLEKRIAAHRLARKSSSLGWLFGPRARAAEHIRGLYIFGEVGRGKTMLMDLFFEASPVARKRRAHFHEFMLDVHERIYAIRAKMKVGEFAGDDPIKLVAEQLF